MDYLRDCAGPKIVENWTSRFRGLGQGSLEKMSSRWDELERSVMSGLWTAVPEELDDFAACKIERTADIADLFVLNFFFGCEPDDPTVTYARAIALKSISKHQFFEIGLIPARFEAFVLDANGSRGVLP
jgi:hypothetical protein